MRILHVTRETAGDRRFGIGRSLEPTVTGLRAAGHHVEYLTQQHLGPRALQARQEWTRRTQSWMRPWFGQAGEVMAAIWVERLNMSRLAAKVAARDAYDIVHLHDPWLAAGFRLARQAFGARHCRWGVTQHGFGSYTHAIAEEGAPYTPALLRWQLRLEANVLHAAGWVISPTADGRHQLARDLGLAAAPGHWHAVPHPRPALSWPTRAAARAQLGLSESEWFVLTIGRINPVKRMDSVVRACLHTRRPMHLMLLGEGDATPLRQLIEQTPDARLRFDARVVDDVAPYLAACDIYVSAARNESFGMANLEALACGAPSICTAVGGVPEVTAGRAWLVPGSDTGLDEVLSQALCALQDDPQCRQRLAENGRAHVAACPDGDEVARRHEAIYRRLA
jgi:glycosyltransferase involved in cell wall biosynthesis